MGKNKAIGPRLVGSYPEAKTGDGCENGIVVEALTRKGPSSAKELSLLFLLYEDWALYRNNRLSFGILG